MIVLDTNVVSEFGLRAPSPNVRAWILRQEPTSLFLCAPVISEMAYGAERVRLRHGSDRYFGPLQILIEQRFRDRILPIDTETGRWHGIIRARREATGRPIGLMDALLAATCIVHGAALATRNVRDFADLDLSLINPFEAA